MFEDKGRSDNESREDNYSSSDTRTSSEDPLNSAHGDNLKRPAFEFIAACDCYLTQLHYRRQKLVALGRCVDEQLCQERLTL